MKGWIIQRNYPGKIISYETTKMLELAPKMGIELSLHDPKEFEIIVDKNNRDKILLNGEYTPLPDFIIPRMGATTTYFAFALIRHFENLGVYCVNAPSSIETVKDKLFQMQQLADAGFSVPKTIMAKIPLNIDRIKQELSFPLIVKALSGTQGSGVFLCENENMLEDLMKVIEIANRDSGFVLQEFIADSRGKDLRIFVVGNKILGGMKRSASDDSFKANFSRGGTTNYYEVSDELNKKVLDIAKLFKLEIAGIDLLFDKDSFRVCEVNSSPGFKGFEEANNNINVAEEILKYVKKQVSKSKK